jgi:hypothetical protein
MDWKPELVIIPVSDTDRPSAYSLTSPTPRVAPLSDGIPKWKSRKQ